VPTRRSPDCANATTDGVVRPPSAFSITVGSPPSSTAMHEFVVPRSMPMVLPMCVGTPCVSLSLKNLSRSVSDYRPCGRTDLREDTVRTIGSARVAGAPPVAQDVDVEFELGAAWREIEHRVVDAIRGPARRQQPQPRTDAPDMRVDRDVT